MAFNMQVARGGGAQGVFTSVVRVLLASYTNGQRQRMKTSTLILGRSWFSKYSKYFQMHIGNTMKFCNNGICANFKFHWVQSSKTYQEYESGCNDYPIM